MINFSRARTPWHTPVVTVLVAVSTAEFGVGVGADVGIFS